MPVAATSTIRIGRLPVRTIPPRVVLTIALVAWGITEAIVLDGAWPPAARIAFAVVTLTPILVIDRWPWAVVAILLAGTAVEFRADVLGISVTPMQGIVIAGWVVGATILDRTRSAAALIGLIAVTLVATLGLSPLGMVLACLLGWSGARATRSVRDRRAEALSVLRSARHTSADLRRSEVDAERRRLARELDVAVLRAARRIGADARRAETLLASDPQAAAAALRTIAGTVRAAMRQMRQALAVLRPDDGDDGGSPQPDGLTTAIAALRGHGVPVGVRDSGDDEPATTLATARIVEIVAHSPWRPRRVDLRRTDDGAWIRLQSRGPVTGDERLALTRCAERARLHSGTVRVRRRPRPWDLHGRMTTVHVPVLTRTPRRGPGLVGIAAGVVAALVTAVDIVTGDSVPTPPGSEPSALAITASSVLTGAAVAGAWTRRPVLLVLFAAVAFLRAWIVGFVGLDATTLPLMAFTAYVVPLWVRDPRRQWIVATTLAVTGAAIVLLAWEDAIGVSDVVIMAMSLAVPWVIATAVRDAAEDASRLTVLRWATARDDLIAAQQAVDDERRRVARDLHDLVGHGLSLVSVQAWGAERALPQDVDRARQGIAAIRRVVSSAVSELERLVVPWEDESEDETPSAAAPRAWDAEASTAVATREAMPPASADAPSISDVVDEARRSGLPVTLDVDAARSRDADDLPAAVAVALRRVVQESLTNVVRHAGPVETTVRLRAGEDAIELEVVNRLGRPDVVPGPSGGMGLLGMRERIEDLGGTFRAGERAGRYVVVAWVPLASATSVD